MSALSIIFITVLICAELDFFALLFCKEISEWLKARADILYAKATSLRISYELDGYIHSKLATEQDNKTPPDIPYSPDNETDTEIYKREGTE